MANSRKYVLIILVVLYLLLKILGGASSPVTLVVVLYESEIGKGSTFDESEVMNGTSANELRSLDRWRGYDKDQLPNDKSILREKALKGQDDPKRWIPWLFIFHGKELTWSGRLPVPESAFKELLKSQGGI